MFHTARTIGGSARTPKTQEEMSRAGVDHVVGLDFTGGRDQPGGLNPSGMVASR